MPDSYLCCKHILNHSNEMWDFSFPSSNFQSAEMIKTSITWCLPVVTLVKLTGFHSPSVKPGSLNDFIHHIMGVTEIVYGDMLLNRCTEPVSSALIEEVIQYTGNEDKGQHWAHSWKNLPLFTWLIPVVNLHLTFGNNFLCHDTNEDERPCVTPTPLTYTNTHTHGIQ